MTDIVKGVISGGWALLVGWVLPAALSVLLFTLVVYPSLHDVPPFGALPANAITLVSAAVTMGIVFSALQTPLYRILEGYMLWPRWLFQRGQQRQIERRSRLRHVLNYAGYVEAKSRHENAERTLDIMKKGGDLARLDDAKETLDRALKDLNAWTKAGIEAENWLADPVHGRKTWHPRKASDGERVVVNGGSVRRLWACRLRRQTVAERAAGLPHLRRQVLAEHLARYPVDNQQILPTLLGNAIRRFERFGPDHYGLDQQRLWYELTAAAPEGASKQVDQMRTAVDFFVSLFYGQIIVAVAAITTFFLDPNRREWLGYGAVAAIALAILTYRIAVVTTDEWAFAVQALLNVGREPLAKALSLTLPAKIEEEQEMWKSVSRFLRPKPTPDLCAKLDPYRATSASSVNHQVVPTEQGE